MSEIQPIVSNASIGNATVAIDCVWLKCIESINWNLNMEEVPIVCDWAAGQVTSLRGNPNGLATINAFNLNSTILKYALDANVTVKAAAETVSCEEHTITWVVDSATTPTQYVATVLLNSPEVVDVLAYTDSACLVAWDSGDPTPSNDIAISNACKGELTLTVNLGVEPATTLYFAYTHNTETPVGATLIKPPMDTFASDHKLHILHREASTGDLVLDKFWRVQIIPAVERSYDNTNKLITIPIQLRILADPINHPDAPLGQTVIIPAADSEAADFTYDFYKKVRP